MNKKQLTLALTSEGLDSFVVTKKDMKNNECNDIEEYMDNINQGDTRGWCEILTTTEDLQKLIQSIKKLLNDIEEVQK